MKKNFGPKNRKKTFVWPEIFFRPNPSPTDFDDTYSYANQGQTDSDPYKYRGIIVQKSTNNLSRLKEPLPSKNKDKNGTTLPRIKKQPSNNVRLPAMKEIYKKVIQGNANDNLKMIIVIHGLFASELKACLIQEFPEKYKDGYDFLDSSNGPGLANPGNMQSSHHSKHPIFVRSVENNVIPDNTSNFVREALQDKDNTLNLVVTSKNREFLKTIRKKYKTVINKNSN